MLLEKANASSGARTLGVIFDFFLRNLNDP